MNSNRYRSLLAETTDEQLRHEFLKLIAQEGRQRYMLQIAEKNISNPSARKTCCSPHKQKDRLAAVSPKSDQMF